MKMIDPTPLGWMYGFPKELPDDVPDVYGWLIENGYPEELTSYCKYRIWEENTNESTNR